MNNDGNFMLLDQNNSAIWETFKNPTDTILPGQILNTNTILSLRSRFSEEDYREGSYRLSFQTDGNLVLYSVSESDSPVSYWSTGTVKNDPLASYNLTYDEQGEMYINEGGKRIINLTKPDADSSKDFYFKARIDSYGIFRQYRYRKCCDKTWIEVQRYPNDVCLAITLDKGKGVCGYNSICSTNNGKPKCECPRGYSYYDENNPMEGCRPNFELPICVPNGWYTYPELVDFEVRNNTNWPLSDYRVHRRVDDLETCKKICLDDCFCAVAIFSGSNCWLKRYPLTNGRREYGTALIKLPKNIANPYMKKKQNSTLVIVLSVLLGSSAFVNFLFVLALCLAIFLYNKGLLNFLSGPTSSSGGNVRSYTFKELEEATGGFKQMLGKGASGKVYKGVLKSDPKRFVAVKKLEKLEPGEKEFRTEVNAIGQTHHKNLLRLLGFCDEKGQHLIVYEHMSNGSLATFLFGITRPDWNQRVKIAIGIARGLLYLHEECSNQIIHCDIKPQNILLDEFMTPKISDFGLAKLLLAEQSRAARTHIRGTIGYFAPEWFRKASITVKVDVYSFGAVLLEMICCKSSVEFGMGDEEIALMDWVYDCYCTKKLNKLIENDEEARNDIKTVERLVMAAIWCIQEDPSLRPPMRTVTQMLEGSIHVPVPPSPSSYSSSSSIYA